MITIKQRISNLVLNKNFKRAVIIYTSSLIIGLAGVLTIGTNGWYVMTCVPGFCSGVAAALLSNGHQNPVTFKSIAATVSVTLVFTAASWIIGVPVPAFLLGTVLSFIGSFAGLQFCRWENKKIAKKEKALENQETPEQSSEQYIELQNQETSKSDVEENTESAV